MRFLLVFAFSLTALPALAQGADIDRPIELHLQSTYLRQSKPAFPSPYSGPKSLGPARAGSYSFTSTAFVGARAAEGLEIYFNPEVTAGVLAAECGALVSEFFRTRRRESAAEHGGARLVDTPDAAG